MSGHSFDDLVRRTMEAAVPLTAHFTLTQRCDLDCVHCYLPDKRSGESLGVREFGDILGQLRQAGTLFVTLSGGECLVHPDFFEMAERIREQNLALRVYTNGNRVQSEAAARLAAMHPMEVAVSIYGPTAEVHESVTRVKGSFERSVAAIGHLTDLGLRVLMKAPMMRANFRHAAALRDLAASLGVELQASAYLYPPGGDDARCAAIACDGAELSSLMEELEPSGPKPRPDGTAGRGLCGAGNNYVAIGHDGKVYPCPMFDTAVGDLRADTFERIWREAPLLKALRGMSGEDLDECRTCDVRTLCSRCVASAARATGTLDGPDPTACSIARARSGVR